MPEDTRTPATSVEEQVKKLTEFVKAEAVAAKKAVKMQMIVTAVFTLILVGYFLVLNSQVKKYTQPKVLATAAADVIKNGIPDLAKMLEGVMNDATPQLADFLSKKAVKEGVPYLVKRSQNMLEGYIHTMSKMTSEYMDKAFSDVVTSNKDSLRQSMKEQPGGDEPSAALKPLRDKMSAIFVDQTTGKPSEARQSIDKSLIALKNLNKRLKKLAASDPSRRDRKEQLGSRILSTYWQWIHRPKLDDIGERQDGKPGDDAPSIVQ